MSVRARKTGNGLYEFDDYMRQPDTRNKWQIVKDAIYNPDDGTVFGHTKKRWGILGIFYLVFYTVLALLCATCYYGLMATIDYKVPKYTLSDSIIGTNPGLGFRPISEYTEERSLIWYSASNATQINTWKHRLDEFLITYNNRTILPNGGRTQMNCNYTMPPQKGKVCTVDMDHWGNCTTEKAYGFNNSAPCVFIKLNRIFSWVPDYYNDPEDLPAEMPEDLKDHIKSLNQTERNNVWISCSGENPHDRESIGELDYYPKNRGFASYYYPFLNQPEYLSPLIAVQFKRPTRSQLINVECRAWAKNIVYSSKKGEKTGAVHFELMVDN